MLLGTVIIGSAFSIALGGILIIAISAVIGLGLGGICGSYIRKRYKDLVGNMSEIEKVTFRAHAMMYMFDHIKKHYDKETTALLLEKIAYEGKKAIALSGDDKSSLVKE